MKSYAVNVLKVTLDAKRDCQIKHLLQTLFFIEKLSISKISLHELWYKIQSKRGKTMKTRVPKIVYGTPIVILSAIIINLVLDDFVIDTSSSVTFNSNPETIVEDFDYSDNLYSGPFAILDGTYRVNDTVFLIGDGIPHDSKGVIDFIRPDGEIHHSLHYDGSKYSVNHYFTPVSQSDLKECTECEFFGIWEISFRSNQGMTYLPITFEVINSD